MPANTPLSESSMLLTLEEISHAVARDGRPADTLSNIVRLLQQRFHTDVCSVYLLEPDRSHLVLAATLGLKPESVGHVRMKLTEGLVGLVAQEIRPLAVDNAPLHPRFKYFPEAGEDAYHSFVGTPLLDRGSLQGVLVVQTKEPRSFSRDEVSMLVAASAQLGPLVSESRTLEQFVEPAHQRLRTLSENLWWTWDQDATSLFRELDPVLWREMGHNPLLLMSDMPTARLEERCRQLVLHSRINYTYRRMQEYLESEGTWGARHAGVLAARPVAYFSAEFGIHESVPIYSGGLGILSGDHIKSASDLAIPLVGIGLYYDQGYFRQRIDADGWQREDYVDINSRELPLKPARDRAGQSIVVTLHTRSGEINARVWQLAVGRNKLYLLDSDIPGNSPEDRELTARLYGGDSRVRIRQELLLGVGGMKALQAMGISPGVIHLNEGHSAFAVLEWMRLTMEREGVVLEEALRRVARKTVFTTHTPVPAGHDRFSNELIEEHLGPLRDSMGMHHDHLMSYGRVDPDNIAEPFCMTVLALKASRRANAVSSLHGEVSRQMWHSLWSGRPEEEVPIGHITNGVHVPSWLAPQMQKVYERHLGPDWSQRSGELGFWDRIHNVSDGELWETHQSLKARLFDFVRRRAAFQAERRGETPEMVAQTRRALSLDVLTIGFARRFATYKRANLVMQELERLADLVNDAQTPLQFVFAGKAHPQDKPGKKLIQEVIQLTREPRFAGRVVFVEDYDINVARHLVQGVDVWLNNPRRPLEASGTSGMKVVLNGGLNLSILDGWWAEAFDGANGFAIGSGETHVDDAVLDIRDREALFHALDREVIPLYYDRDRDGVPRGWVARMKRAIRTLGWRFSSDRMVKDYVLHSYIPAAGGTSSNMPK